LPLQASQKIDADLSFSTNLKESSRRVKIDNSISCEELPNFAKFWQYNGSPRKQNSEVRGISPETITKQTWFQSEQVERR